MSDLLKIIKSRRTIRKYKNKKVPKKLIEEIVEAGVWAPSPHNSQPWYFIVVNNQIKKIELLDELRKKPTNLLTSIKIFLRNTIDIINNAPVLMFVYNRKTFSKKANRLGRKYYESAKFSEVQGISASIQNMLLVAANKGLGSAWLTVPLFLKDRINKHFNETEGDLIAVLTFGYADEKGKTSKRKDITQTVKYC